MARRDADFVNYSWTDSDDKSLNEFTDLVGGDIWEILEKTDQEGYKFTHGYYPEHSSFMVMMRPIDSNPNNQGLILSSWSDDLHEAYWMTLYKHHSVYSGNWEKPKKGVARRG